MIRLNPSVSSLNTLEYLATKKKVTAVKDNSVLSGACCFGCTFDLPVFAYDIDPTDNYKNDKTDFIISTPKGSTTTGTLIKIAPNGTETSYTITNNDYGYFFPTDTLKSKVWAFIIDWWKVQDVIGYGKYKFNITVLNAALNEVYNEDSVCFNLMPYSCELAHRTIKVRGYQGGYFEDGFDYTNISYTFDGIKQTRWYQEIRLYGRFFRESRTIEVDNIVNEIRGQEQVQTRTFKNYILKLDNIQTKVSNHLIEDRLQAPEVYISDYNINNIEKYVDRRVSLTDLGTPLITPLSKNEFHEIKLVDWQQNNVHRYK